MITTGAGKTHKGQVRSVNQDAFVCDPRLGLYVVSDGMGGHAAGEVASSTATQAVLEIIRDGLAIVEGVRQHNAEPSALVTLARRAVQTACRRVWDAATRDADLAGMGATLTLLITVEDKAVMAHVGDSRLYLVRAGRAHQLSADHTFARALLEGGVIGKDELHGHPYAHVLTRSLGNQKAVQVDTLLFDLAIGDRLLLASDGLTNYVDDDAQVAEWIGGADLGAVAAALVDHANAQGGRDNITAVVVDVVSASAAELVAETRSGTEVVVQLDALSSVFLFEDLELAHVAGLLSRCRMERFDAGEVLVHRGDVVKHLFIVVEGELEAEREGTRVRTLTRGEHAFATALLYDRQSRSTLRALKSTRVLVLEQETFATLVRQRPRLGVSLLGRLGRRLGKQLDEMLIEEAEQR